MHKKLVGVIVGVLAALAFGTGLAHPGGTDLAFGTGLDHPGGADWAAGSGPSVQVALAGR
ncbi:hypothetical protein ABZ208_20155 [Streptomyces sp. NPDC006208]|uniref:hypothetical protein n=1 Tax=Streptomyces sp. NPDC006208 TaxID=3156734 RepID=UPI0033B60DF8